MRMEETKNTISDAQKAAQKKYDKKTKTVSIKYTPSDMNEYQRLKSYLDRTGQSINKFIKGLIHNFFESGQDKKSVENKPKSLVEEKGNRREQYYPYSWIDNKNIQFLLDKFGQKVMNHILDEFASMIENELDNIMEDKGCSFDDWISEIEERMKDGEFQNGSEKEICKELINDMCNFL